MGSSFVEFRGRGFWAKDTPLQTAMYLLHRELADQGELTALLARWRDDLIAWAAGPGGGCVNSGLGEYPCDAPIDPLVAVIRGAPSRQHERLIASDLARARVAVGDESDAETFWAGVEEDVWIQNTVATVLAAFLELVSGKIDPRHGQLVYGAESAEAHARMIPGGDWRDARAEQEAKLSESAQALPQAHSFGPDAEREGTPEES